MNSPFATARIPFHASRLEKQAVADALRVLTMLKSWAAKAFMLDDMLPPIDGFTLLSMILLDRWAGEESRNEFVQVREFVRNVALPFVVANPHR